MKKFIAQKVLRFNMSNVRIRVSDMKMKPGKMKVAQVQREEAEAE